jgi:hypothetical protein
LDISVVVVFHDMRREAARTLFTLSPDYQRDVGHLRYEVIAVDSGSSLPIAADEVARFGPNFRYRYFDDGTPSPVGAVNAAVAASSGRMVVVMIDGARMLSPGILGLMHRAAKAYDRPFVHTLSMHLGPEVQNVSVTRGYNQAVEDALLAEVDWQRDGYRLFELSVAALSSGVGFLSALTESNCFALPREVWDAHGGLDDRFVMPGGGFANLDFFGRLMADPTLTPVMLLGEATFHQFHGGVATNVPVERHPGRGFADEYGRIRGRPFAAVWRTPVYFGVPTPHSWPLLRRSAENPGLLSM